MNVTTMAEAIIVIGQTFSFAPFNTILQPLIDEALCEHGKDRYRKGTLLVPNMLIWLVLVMTLRRDLNTNRVLDWMLSGFRWLTDLLPAEAKLVSDGAISHARAALGVGVFRTLFDKLTATFQPLPADFHGRISVIFDGSTGTMPDTEANQAAFGKPGSRSGAAGFPQVRLMALLAVAHRRLLDIAYAPYTGKGTGERALVRCILLRLSFQHLLFLLDAGLYAFDLLWHIAEHGHEYLVKVPAQVQFKRVQRLADGSWLAELTGKIVDPDRPLTPTGRKHWKTVTLTVRVMRVEIPGFRPFWLMTNLLDPAITAREIAVHYPPAVGPGDRLR